MNILHGDCLDVMATLAPDSIDACVTDPPYHLTSIVKRFGKPGSAPAKDRDGVFQRASSGFMGKEWDGGDIAMRPETWAAVLRVLKPGAHLVAFGGTRTFHRVACAIEDAGFEIRDTIMWVYGSGFPKSHDAGNGWGTALKPAHEPICVARKPLIGTVAANVQAHGTGAINIDGCRVETDENLNGGAYSGALRQRDEYTSTDSIAGAVPLSRLNRGAGEYQAPIGRWPANLIHDGSEEVLAAFPGTAPSTKGKPRGSVAPGDGWGMTKTGAEYADAGTAARFFYCAKASKADREEGNKHPTVKPTALMRHLCRLVTPVGGTVLDPFLGSGSTGKAATLEGFGFVGIEREAEYVEIARARLAHAERQRFEDIFS